jgi:hypothetical protein
MPRKRGLDGLINEVSERIESYTKRIEREASLSLQDKANLFYDRSLEHSDLAQALFINKSYSAAAKQMMAAKSDLKNAQILYVELEHRRVCDDLFDQYQKFREEIFKYLPFKSDKQYIEEWRQDCEARGWLPEPKVPQTAESNECPEPLVKRSRISDFSIFTRENLSVKDPAIQCDRSRNKMSSIICSLCNL